MIGRTMPHSFAIARPVRGVIPLDYQILICIVMTALPSIRREAPHRLSKLKDANKDPVFVFKHIRDIRSPIDVAQQKQAMRQQVKQSEAALSDSTSAAENANANSRTARAVEHPILATISRQS
ncbi:hypothetical protein M422DRAFT_41599 [Sphaerobolus stellatus SS14]|nr:hypothetical protein M422DRAFT_41599 [Sphaerobolus stellatus SS14]